ncbi:hypothetical protein S40288_10616 [Stachybotrys chartarum IBT 40288]|nr:hypothetical protein S40288_10616 [Stachybotrys chartarum IBT 40288]
MPGLPQNEVFTLDGFRWADLRSNNHTLRPFRSSLRGDVTLGVDFHHDTHHTSWMQLLEDLGCTGDQMGTCVASIPSRAEPVPLRCMFEYLEMMLLLRGLGTSRHDRRAAQTPGVVVMCSSEQAASGVLNDFLARLARGHGSELDSDDDTSSQLLVSDLSSGEGHRETAMALVVETSEVEDVTMDEINTEIVVPGPYRSTQRGYQYPAPFGYLVTDCSTLSETSPYSCPHVGCDGFSLDTLQDCIIHEAEWHSGPYTCSQCNATFAAQAALSRHAAASGHLWLWACRQEGCSKRGHEFFTPKGYLEHVLVEKAHQGEMSTTAAEASSDSLSDYPMEESMCLEACCPRYQNLFHSSAETERHMNSRGHVGAKDAGWALAKEDMTEEERAKRQEACRNLTCDKADCEMFGRKLASTHSYFHHISTKMHLEGNGMQKKKPAAKEAKPKERAPRQCLVTLCHKYLHVFRNASNYRAHAASDRHVHAAATEEADQTPGLAIRTDTPGRQIAALGGQLSPVTPTHGQQMMQMPGDGRVKALEEAVGWLRSRVAELEGRPGLPHGQPPRPQRIHDDHDDEANHQTPAKHPPMDVEQVADEALVQVPLGPCGEQDGGELRGDGVEDVAPVEGAPHARRDGGHVGRPAEVEGKGPRAPDGEEDGQGHLDEEGEAGGLQGGVRDAEDAAEGHAARAGGGGADVAAPRAPVVADHGEAGCLEGEHGDHDEAPADGVEDAPGGGVRGAHGDDVADQPEVQRVADGGLGEGEEARAEEHREGAQRRPRRRSPRPAPRAHVGDARGPEEVGQADDGGGHVAGELDAGLHVDGGGVAADVEVGDDEHVEEDVDGELGRADDERHVGLVEGPRGRGDGRLEGGAQGREGADADVGDAEGPDLLGDEPAGEGAGAGGEADAHDEAEEGLDEDEGVGEGEAPRQGARGPVADDEPGDAGQALVEDLGDDADVGVRVRGDDKRGVDARDPYAGEGTVEGRQREGGQVEEQGALPPACRVWAVAGFGSRANTPLSLVPPVAQPYIEDAGRHEGGWVASGVNEGHVCAV